MAFSPENPIVKHCLQGMALADQNNPEEALNVSLKAWHEATRDFEKFIAAYFVARYQQGLADKLDWLETTLQLAISMDDDTVRSALPMLYTDLARCHETLDDPEQAAKYVALAVVSKTQPTDTGPFYHGTKADLLAGDLLTPGGLSNYQAGLQMNHIYFTARVYGAGLAAQLAQGDNRPRVYVIEPVGAFEDDPNVTNKKFPGNPTRSYRSLEPLKIIGEISDWQRLSPEALQQWREKLAKKTGAIIN